MLALGVFGAALLYSDGIIAPAISVISAVERVGVAAPALESFVIPITCAILIGLFAMQRLGTGKAGAAFGPITLGWFLLLSLLGLRWIIRTPESSSQSIEWLNPQPPSRSRGS